MRLITILSLFFLSINLFAQEDNIDEYNRNLDELTIPKKGPNKKKYTHAFLSYGFIIGASEGDSSAIKYCNSTAFSVGFRSKYRIAKFYEIGFEIAYLRTRFLPVQDSSKNIPNSILHDKEMLANNALDIAVFNRFKLKNKDHSAGVFLDLGAYVDWNYRSVHYTKNKDLVQSADRTVVKNYQLDYLLNYAYGVNARIGFNRLAIDFRYRLSDVFDKKANYGELPNMVIALQLGLHQ